jgi:RNA polymerase sigma factor (sigma-70 family)
MTSWRGHLATQDDRGRRTTPNSERLKLVAADEPQIEVYMATVRTMARSLRSRLRIDAVELEELEADGYEGLVRAANDYDPSKGPLVGYIFVRCRGAMIDGLRRRMLSTRTQREKGFHEPLVLSLDETVADGFRIDEVIPDPFATSADDVIEQVSSASACSELAALPQRHRRILFARFLQNRSRRDVAAAHGVSPKTIAKCERQVRRRLHHLEKNPEEQPLTAKELKVLKLAAEGATSAETAIRLRKARETVKSQRQAIIAKLRARNIINAVAIGYQLGLLD